MAKFTAAEWKKIRAKLNADPQRYGLPTRVYGSVVLASANVRKLGAVAKRDADTWHFFADVFRHFDLLAVQEVLDEMEGLRHLKRLMGEDFGMIVSDTTGAFPNEDGLDERLAFIFNWTVVNRKELVTDVTYDRSKVVEIIAKHSEAMNAAVAEAKMKKDYLKKKRAYDEKLRIFEAEGGRKPKEPSPLIKMPVFVSFIRTPFGVMFESHGHPGSERYTFMAINAHLYFGNYLADRHLEVDALLDWIMGRVLEGDDNDSLNIVLLGDLNLDFNDPDKDRKRIEAKIRRQDKDGGKDVKVYFPFLHPHPKRPGQQLMGRDGEVLQTNARISETYDQIGIFSRDERLKKLRNADAGLVPRGLDFGVFDFVNLFSEALHGKAYKKLKKTEQAAFVKRFEFSVSDHMPLWLRLPLPDVEEGRHVTAP